MSNFENKKVSVIGAARSGQASAVELKKLGAHPFLSESKPAEKFTETIRLLDKSGIDYEFGGHTNRVYDCDLIVTSPGVPQSSGVLAEATKRNIKIISELELGFQLCKGKVLAITGSNGKTTTTSLVGEIFKHSSLTGAVAGNIGNPFVAIAGSIGPDDWAILEVSTFQLEWIEKFKPHVAAVLNITPDHLDRHGSMENYITLKLKVFANQNGTNVSVLNSDNDILRGFKPRSETWMFSTKHEIENGCFIEKDMIVLNYHDKKEEIIKIDEIGIRGPHNLANACAASACCAAAGIDNETIAKGLRSFKGVEHRLEQVGLMGGVSFVNDSKATNVDAVYWALQSVSPPIILIAGGRDKDSDFRSLRELIKEKVKAVVLLGEAADKIARAFDGCTEIYRAETIADAASKAYKAAKPAGTVLLSPACASFDMFDNYEHRGQAFKQAVKKLIGDNV